MTSTLHDWALRKTRLVGISISYCLWAVSVQGLQVHVVMRSGIRDTATQKLKSTANRRHRPRLPRYVCRTLPCSCTFIVHMCACKRNGVLHLPTLLHRVRLW